MNVQEIVSGRTRWFVYVVMLCAWAWGADVDAQELDATFTLKDLVDEALAKNPLIQSALLSAESRKSLIRPAETLPEPVVSFETMGNLFPPTLQAGDPSSGRTLAFSQEIPFPGKLGLQGKMASKEAEQESWSYEQVRREIIAQVKVTYYEHWLISKSMDILNKNKDLLERFSQISEAKFRVGEGIQQDVVKSQVEISKVLDRRLVLGQREGVSIASLNSLLYRAPETPLGRLADIEPSPFDQSMEGLFRLAEASSPMLQMQKRIIEKEEYAVQLAQKNYYPDFEVGFSYVNRVDMPEMYGLMAAVKVPLYYWRKQRPELQSATTALSGTRAKYEWLAARTYFELKDLYLTVTTSKRLLDLYGKGIVPQATVSVESATAGYQTGSVDFLTLVDNLVTLLDYELKYYEVLAEYQKALARLEAIVGVDLTSRLAREDVNE